MRKQKRQKCLEKKENWRRKLTYWRNNIGCNNANKKFEISFQTEEKTRALEKIVEYKTKGAILMKKCRSYKDGEH